MSDPVIVLVPAGLVNVGALKNSTATIKRPGEQAEPSLEGCNFSNVQNLAMVEFADESLIEPPWSKFERKTETEAAILAKQPEWYQEVI